MKAIPFRKLTNRDIIKNPHVSSRTLYRYFKDQNDLLEKVKDIDANSYHHTLTFCAKKRKEILLLLSQNGDIGFLIKIKNLGREELKKDLN